MKKIQTLKLIFIVFTLFIGVKAEAQDKPEVVATIEDMGEKEVSDQADIITYLSSTNDFSKLVAAVKSAGLLETLSGKGPFTIFAPTNAAFEKVDTEKFENLLKPENTATLKSILKYHVIAGKLDATSVISAIEKSEGKAQLKTLGGQLLTAYLKDGAVFISDVSGNSVKVIDADIKQTNGVIHIIDGVFMPTKSKKEY